MPVRSHYENLKVSRDAPTDVIRAAYQTLMQTQTDRLKAGDAQAERNRRIINEAYEVLIDPVRRANHDEWIRKEELREEVHTANTKFYSSPKTHQRSPWSLLPQLDSVARTFKTNAKYVQAGLLGLLIITVLYFAVNYDDELTNQSAPHLAEKYDATPVPASSTNAPDTTLQPEALRAPAVTHIPYQRPTLSPKGLPWPLFAAYLQGYPLLNSNGHSQVSVDNSENDFDAMVKLVSIQASASYPARVFFIPAHSKFIAKNLTPGEYDVRFRNLSDGLLSRSDRFDLSERRTADGTVFSKEELTLYTVPGGTMQTWPLNEVDF